LIKIWSHIRFASKAEDYGNDNTPFHFSFAAAQIAVDPHYLTA
jgi:hypothetical protein